MNKQLLTRYHFIEQSSSFVRKTCVDPFVTFQYFEYTVVDGKIVSTTLPDDSDMVLVLTDLGNGKFEESVYKVGKFEKLLEVVE